MNVRDVLEDAGLESSEDTIAAAIADGIATLERLFRSETGWPERDAEALRQGGLDPSASTEVEREAWMTESAATFARLVASSLSVQAAARTLGVDPSRIRQRLSDRTLYGFKVRRQWRVPAWQLVGGREVPGLSEVLPWLTINDPVAVSEFLMNPNIDLSSDGQPIAPLQWLLAGRAPGRVSDLAAALVRS